MKERTRGKSGCRRKSAAACRKVSRCAKVAWGKRNLFRNVQTQRKYGPQKELAVIRREMNHHALVARRKGNIVRSGPGPRLSEGSRRCGRTMKAERE
jgi:hypothetical protein